MQNIDPASVFLGVEKNGLCLLYLIDVLERPRLSLECECVCKPFSKMVSYDEVANICQDGRGILNGQRLPFHLHRE